jgi:hypothetical protein
MQPFQHNKENTCKSSPSITQSNTKKLTLQIGAQLQRNKQCNEFRGAKTFYISLFMLAYEVFSFRTSHTEVYFHNRGKLPYTTFHNQFGKSIEWLYFSMVYTRFRVRPSGTLTRIPFSVPHSGLNQYHKIIQRDSTCNVCCYTHFHSIQKYFH